ncbi:hypothetical protein ACI79G_04705 [Geodermatophilus sp. SYSU D00779]
MRYRDLDRVRRVEVTGGHELPALLAAPGGVACGGTVGGVRRRARPSSLPFWLLLGSVPLDGWGLLPASAPVFVCPVVVATVLAAIGGGTDGTGAAGGRIPVVGGVVVTHGEASQPGSIGSGHE